MRPPAPKKAAMTLAHSSRRTGSPPTLKVIQVPSPTIGMASWVEGMSRRAGEPSWACRETGESDATVVANEARKNVRRVVRIQCSIIMAEKSPRRNAQSEKTLLSLSQREGPLRLQLSTVRRKPDINRHGVHLASKGRARSEVRYSRVADRSRNAGANGDPSLDRLAMRRSSAGVPSHRRHWRRNHSGAHRCCSTSDSAKLWQALPQCLPLEVVRSHNSRKSTSMRGRSEPECVRYQA
jgi:hypothetical protein